MRVLKFDVSELNIEKNPGCDFGGLVPGTEGYLKAEFSFTRDWDGYVRAVSFYDGITEYAIALEDGKSCIIPGEVTKRPAFGIKVTGKKSNGVMITNRIIVTQNGGN